MKVAVIGRGMIGSAAARHLAKAGVDVTLIGPSEPADWAQHTGAYSSHHDEARITRSIDPSGYWSRVAQDSIARYADIADESGVDFYHETGVLIAGIAGTPYISDTFDVAAAQGLVCETWQGAALADRFPYFAFPSRTQAAFEPKNAGHINPRSLVRAQGIAAQRAGATILKAQVSGVEDVATGAIVTIGSERLRFDQILVCTGGYSDDLLSGQLGQRVYARTVLLAELSDQEQARLTAMPPLLWYEENGDDTYLLPPVRYPDGRVCLKIGGDPNDILLRSEAEKNEWFQGDGDPVAAAHLKEVLLRLMPDLSVDAWQTRPCITTFTDTDRPDIRRLGETLSVASGGSGKGAKSSDELGRLGACTVLEQALPDWAC